MEYRLDYGLEYGLDYGLDYALRFGSHMKLLAHVKHVAKYLSVVHIGKPMDANIKMTQWQVAS